MFGLWYLIEAPWKMGNNKKNPRINKSYGYGAIHENVPKA